MRPGLVNSGNLVGICIISRYSKRFSIKKIRMLSGLKLSLSFNQKCVKIDFKNLQEPNWVEVIEEQKLDVYKFRIDVKEDADYCRYVVFKKIKSIVAKI